MKNVNILASNRLAIILLALALTACGTVTEKTNVSKRPSHDPQDTSEPTSGIFAIWRNEQGEAIGRIVSLRYHERYEALRSDYGDQFKPELKKYEGFTPTKWRNPKSGKELEAFNVIKSTHEKMGQMIQWKKDGRAPTGTFKKLLNKFT